MLYQIDEENSYVIFKLGDINYGIKSKYIQQIEMVEKITPVPNTPSYIEGVALFRGRVVPVINLRVRLGMEKIPYDIKSRIIIVKIEEREIGLLVDSAREYITIPREKVQESFENIFDISEKLLEGIANLDDKLVLILNLEELLKEGGKSNEEEEK